VAFCLLVTVEQGA